MKNKILILLGAFIFCMTLGLKDAMAAAAASDVNCTNPCISSYEIQDGQVAATDIANNAVTNAKIADGAVTTTKITDGSVTNTKIGDGSVTDAKITGPISTSKLNIGTTTGTVAAGDHNHDAVYQKKYANVIVVAKSGGDFTSIQAAIDSITSTDDNPYLIKVMPGTYTENITMKSYIHLQWAGRDVATIQSPSTSNDVITLNNLTNVTISGFTLKGGSHVIYNSYSSFTLAENTISENDWGISNVFSSPVITKNIITGSSQHGIYNYASSPVIRDNTIAENGGYGVVNNSSAPIITGNIITGSNYYGVFNVLSSTPVISNNRITGNGGTSYGDIYVDSTSTPNISFNVYDTINGTTGVGQFNVKSDGSLAPAP